METHKYILCEYDCGREAKFQLKNGKWCCSKSQNSCPSTRKKNSIAIKNVWNKPEEKEKLSQAMKKSWNKPEIREKYIKTIKEAMNRLEVKEKQKESHLGKNNYGWKGGCYEHYHFKARKLFSTPICQMCGINLEEHFRTHKKRFHLHCVSKDYTILEPWNWQCLCIKDHHKTIDHKNQFIKGK